jgi:hypothetical protein
MPSATDLTPIAQDLPCFKCAYNLRTALPTSLCPECATPVRVSIEFQKSQPSLAQGAGGVAAAAFIFFIAGVLSLPVQLAGNILPYILARGARIAILNPIFAARECFSTMAFIAAFLLLASSRLSPPMLRLNRPHPIFLIICVAILACLRFMSGGLYLLESPGGIVMTQPWLEFRYVLYVVRVFFDLPVTLYGFIFFRHLTARPELASFSRFVLAFFITDLAFALITTVFYLYLLILINTVPRPPAFLTPAARILDGLSVVANVALTLFWAAFSYRAGKVARAASHPL